MIEWSAGLRNVTHLNVLTCTCFRWEEDWQGLLQQGGIWWDSLYTHTHTHTVTKYNQNLGIKTEPVTAYATVYVRLLLVYIWPRNQRYQLHLLHWKQVRFYVEIQIICGHLFILFFMLFHKLDKRTEVLDSVTSQNIVPKSLNSDPH